MADLFRVEVDASGVLAMLQRLGPAAEQHVRAAAKDTAERIKREAERRLHRQTGKRAGTLTVEEDTERKVFWVSPQGAKPRNVPLWLELGTIKMTARPFLQNSARLEDGAHLRRLAAALQDAIDEVSR